MTTPPKAAPAPKPAPKPEPAPKAAAKPKPEPKPAPAKAPAAKDPAKPAPKAAPAKAEPKAEAPARRGAGPDRTASPAPDAMVKFAKWIAARYPEFAPVDPVLVTIASKDYGHYKGSEFDK